MGRPSTSAASSSSAQNASPLGRVILTRRQISRRVGQLAKEISDGYRDRHVVLLGVLTGAVVFLADLVRRLELSVEIGFVGVRSYPGNSVRSRGPRVVLPIDCDLAGQDVLIVDDILDSGGTLTTVMPLVAEAGAADVRSCVMLRKARPDVADRIEADFVGFDVPDLFVVGYGLDYDGLYRHLPDVRVLAACDSPAGAGEGSP